MPTDQANLWTSVNGAKGVQAQSADVAPTQLFLDDVKTCHLRVKVTLKMLKCRPKTSEHQRKYTLPKLLLPRKDNIPYPNPKIDQVTVSKVSISAI